MLLTYKDAAKKIGGGVSHEALRAAAEKYGHAFKIGRAAGVLEDELGELIEKCRETPKAPVSTSGPTQARGSSETPGSRTGEGSGGEGLPNHKGVTLRWGILGEFWATS